ncbi:hypothetical protein [Wolbachia endosymbiont of Mansonella perstans]|uniref:hypothetical protein n=1 Tax=Wolbachia endosymbiont of Mansonella perstans TaxID=229526 RepID=UPI001CE10F18|nr:hypothetical protein [Wolbachia endosymbiont of Mansonella perstans]MCA4774330.1 hypothetical protein [Wolbachia endosymbiont of Mansonella perstans]
MSTNWLHDFFFGSNESTIEVLEKLQKTDAEQFQRAFSVLKELQKGQQFNTEQIQIAFSMLKELQKGQQFNSEQIQSMQEHLNSLQERLAYVEEKVEKLTDTVVDQEKIMLTCCVVASVVAIAAISFIGFCIYQGIKSEREKQKGLLDTTGAKPNSLESNTPSAKLGAGDKLNDLQVDWQNNKLLANL